MAENETPKYVGVGALTLVRRSNGNTEYVYAGSPVPADAAPGEVERLEADGFIRRADEPAPAETPTPADPGPAAPARPADSAPKSTWVDYAVQVRPAGQSEQDARADAEGLSRDKLSAKYPA